MSSYLAVKRLHMSSVALSGMLFLLRGFWMRRDSPMLGRRWVKVVPHVVDTVLLGSAVTLAIWSSQYPFAQDWLTAKVLALAVYIALASVALKRGKTRRVRIAAFAAAAAVLLYIVRVALTRQIA